MNTSQLHDSVLEAKPDAASSEPWPASPVLISAVEDGPGPAAPSALSRMERHLWRYLVAQAGRTVSRDELLRRVWGLDPRLVSTRTVDMHVAKLRKKLGVNPRRPSLLETVHGSGYRVGQAQRRAMNA